MLVGPMVLIRALPLAIYSRRFVNQGRLDFGVWILDFGFWILDLGFWILDFGFWILDFGNGLDFA